MTASRARKLGRRRLLLSTLVFVGVLGSGTAHAQPPYAEHQQLLYYLNDQAERCNVRSVKQWEIRRQHIMAHLQSVMGRLPPLQQRVPLAVETVEDQVWEGLRRRKLRYHTDSATEFVSAWLLEPIERNGSAAAILCLHPTVAIGKDEPAGVGGDPDKYYALHLARRGYVTLAPDYPSLGESSHDFAADSYPSGSMQAIVDNIRSVDLLSSLPSVDPDKIGCIGHSLGGHNTLFTATFDPRIKVCVSNCGFTRFHKYYRGDLSGWSGPRYMPMIATHYGNDPDQVPFDFTEIIAALAPRPCLAIAPKADDNFEVSGVRDTIAAARPVYELFGKPANLQVAYPDCGHAFPEAARAVAYAFFDKHLQPAAP